MASNSGTVPETYHGREQAHIKHRLLKSYLEKLFLIVGMSAPKLGITEFCYVDCFAGPWSDDSEDIAGTSIAISLEILETCRETLGSHGFGPKFRALYVEESPKAFERLRAYLAKRPKGRVQAEALQGDFVALRPDILKWCGHNAFVFFFIDPKGWSTVTVDTLQPLMARQQSEFLINFQYDFVNRTASMAAWRQEVAELLGEDVNAEGLAPLDREKLLVNTYRKNLKSKIPASNNFPARSGYVRVLDPQKERAKYHLVYLTSHPRGVIEFMKISDDLDLVQKQVRATKKDQARSNKTGMQDLFGADSLVDPSKDRVEPEAVDFFWRNYLIGGPKQIGESDFADILEETNWFPGDLQGSLVRLIDSGEVINLDAPRRRPKRPLHWDKGDRLKLTREQA